MDVNQRPHQNGVNGHICCGGTHGLWEDFGTTARNPLAAVVQFTATNDKTKNLETCVGLIRKAKTRGAQMVFLPEGFDYLCETFTESIALSEPLTGPVITRYQQVARDLQLWLSLGGYHLKDEQQKRTHNSHIIIDTEGKIVAIYRKTHLCVVDIPGRVSLDERHSAIPGTKILSPVETPIGKTGLMCCYDLRFPEIAGLLTRQGAEVLAYPAAFTQATGIAHWEALLKARAIENQCYVIAAAQYGSHNDKRQSFGHAMIVDPWGTILAQCSDGPGIAVAEIDLERVHAIRGTMPVQSHRRHDLYRLSLGPVRLPIVASDTSDFGSNKIHHSCVFFETTFTVAFVNLKPVVPGHVLVIPKRVCEKFAELTYEEIADIFHVVQVVGKMLELRHGATSSTISVQDGFDAGQTVRHVHVHLLPRKPGDFERDDVYHELETHDKGGNRKARTLAEMAPEAAEYRKLLYSDAL